MKETVLSFGIPSLDELLGRKSDKPDSSTFGIDSSSEKATSICIVGPDGTGKSVFALHLASNYASRAYDNGASPFPKIIYVSTDLSFDKANSVWKNFALGTPQLRWKELRYERNLIDIAPVPRKAFDPGSAEVVLMNTYSPSESKGASSPQPLSDYLSGEQCMVDVAFLDLESLSSGDDWSYLARLLSTLPEPQGYPHLLVIDAVEGLQLMGGDLDAFGQLRDRRSRIAQLVRAARKQCHLVFAVEEPKEGDHYPEQFVADAVIRLRSEDTGNGYLRRTVEVEKARAKNHVRGRHSFTTRSGNGSTTGLQVNADDRRFTNPMDPEKTLSYAYVFHSLDYIYSRQLNKVSSEVGGKNAGQKQALGFGLRYLDDMLLNLPSDPSGSSSKILDPSKKVCGLPVGSVNAIVGPPKSLKSPLCRAFMAEGLRDVDLDPGYLTANYPQIQLTDPLTDQIAYNDLRSIAFKHWHPPTTNDVGSKQTESLQPKLSTVLYFTTEDIDSFGLLERVYHWLHKKKCPLSKHELIAELQALRVDGNALTDTAKQLLAIESRILVRRLEIHNTGPDVLFHIFTENLRRAMKIQLGEATLNPKSELRASANRLRVVIDNWNTIETMYPKVKQDPLFLPSLLFMLRRAGVTTVMAETRFEAETRPAVYQSQSILGDLVDNALYTWNVPFHGHRMVAISPLAAFSSDRRSVTRELKPTSKAPTDELDTCYVDPHLELYSGLTTGEPKPVPLRVRMINETTLGKEYADRINILMRDLFAAVPQFGENVVSVTPEPIEEHGTIRYARLRDVSYLQRTLLDHTVVEQVDEFWVTDEAVNYQTVSDYLLTRIRHKPAEKTDLDDPYRIFRRPAAAEPVQNEDRCRYDFFDTEQLGYLKTEEIFDNSKCRATRLDRVPYTWDFGFLLANRERWIRSRKQKLRNTFGEPLWISNTSGTDATVQDVWEALKLQEQSKRLRIVKWRTFLEACSVVASTSLATDELPAVPFGIPAKFTETVSSLFLEIWFSELHDTGGPAVRPCLGYQYYSHNPGYSLLQMIDQTEPKSKKRVIDTLYKAICLLHEIVSPAGSEGIRSGANPDCQSPAAASRHWYATAAQAMLGFDPRDPIVPLRLPGHYSTRGDWFLSIAQGSRSIRVGECAIDILSSARGNADRLYHGIGLPTRKLHEVEHGSNRGYMTALWTSFADTEPDSRGPYILEKQRVTYDQLLTLGASGKEDSEFQWLWRSSLKNYDRQSRIWYLWICRVLEEFNLREVTFGQEFVRGFRCYDIWSKYLGNLPVNKDVSHEERRSIRLGYRQLRSLTQDLISQLREATRKDEDTS